MHLPKSMDYKQSSSVRIGLIEPRPYFYLATESAISMPSFKSTIVMGVAFFIPADAQKVVVKTIQLLACFHKLNFFRAIELERIVNCKDRLDDTTEYE